MSTGTSGAEAPMTQAASAAGEKHSQRALFRLPAQHRTLAHRGDRGSVLHSEYLVRRYFAPLDGLRALSILLVLTAHTTDPLFGPLHGAVGVTIFFVISGYLITTLLLREQERRGATD